MRKTVWRAFRDTIPLGIGVVLYGLVYGMMGRQEGIPFWFVLGMSLLVFAGSSQMAALELVCSGAGPLTTTFTILVVNPAARGHGRGPVPIYEGRTNSGQMRRCLFPHR